MNNKFAIFEKREKEHAISNSIDWKLVLYIFWVIFSPPILPDLNILLPVTLYSIISIYINYQHTLLEVLKKSIIMTFIKLYLLCYGIVFILMNINIIANGELYFNNYATNIYRLFILMSCLIICIIYFLVRIEYLNYDFYDVFKVFSYAIFLQVGIGLLAFFLPSVKSLFLTIMERNTGSDVFYREGMFSYGYTYRYNGFAGTLLDTFGYGMGLASGLTAIIGFYHSKKYLVWSIIFLIPSVLNSRTGLLIAALGFGIGFLFSLFNSTPRKAMKLIAGFIGIVIFVGIIFVITAINSPNTVGWILDGFKSIFDFLTGQEVRNFSTADQLFSDDFWILPSQLSGKIFGEGFRLYGMSDIIELASDVGYINHIWLVGVFGMVLMYIPFLYLFLSIALYNKFKYSVCISVFLVISFFAMLIKGDMIGYNTGMFMNIFMSFTLTYRFSNFKSTH